MRSMKSITLEISLKPFHPWNPTHIEGVCRQVLTQWRPLLRHTDTVSLMFWCADGSELLDYRGNLDDTFEWCYHIGVANAKRISDPFFEDRHLLYRNDPQPITYRILKEILDTFRRVGAELYPSKVIRLGETFDIGPEFALSDFKYVRHPEILAKRGKGLRAMFIDSCASLAEDTTPYAAYPDGIPDGTPFATFLGKQANVFLRDLGFDYLWLSNGLGFSAEPWNTEGKVFYDNRFHADNILSAQKEVLRFWELLRAECPDYRIETRGTNLSLGLDYSTDAINTYELYQRDYNFLPPPNSPWAALNYNYGLELMGQLSRNAVVPKDSDYLFRYYIHDPWFKNSPWYDRYEGQPHDIYLPMALSRIDKTGKACPANHWNLLSVDNSYGTMPDSCVVEPLPHLLKSIKDAPDAPAPFVWLYPSKEYTSQSDSYRLQEMFGSDWFFCDAINHAFPLSCVLSTDSFAAIDFAVLKDSVLVSPVPYPDSDWEARLFAYLDTGAPVIFVGALTRASQALRDRLGVALCENVPSVTLSADTLQDRAQWGTFSTALTPDPIASIPTLNVKNADGQAEHLLLSQEGILLGKGKDNLYWFCGAQTDRFRPGAAILDRPSEEEAASGGALLRHAARYFGWDITVSKTSPAEFSPLLMLHRSDNAFFFSTYSRTTTAELALSTPYGAPLPIGYEAVYADGKTHYRFPRATHLECRVFVTQTDRAVLSCREVTPGHAKAEATRRRIQVEGLQDATVVFFPETYALEGDAVFAKLFSAGTTYQYDGKCLDSRKGELAWRREGDHYVAEHVTGRLTLQLPDYADWRNRYQAIAEADAHMDRN